MAERMKQRDENEFRKTPKKRKKVTIECPWCGHPTKVLTHSAKRTTQSEDSLIMDSVYVSEETVFCKKCRKKAIEKGDNIE